MATEPRAGGIRIERLLVLLVVIGVIGGALYLLDAGSNRETTKVSTTEEGPGPQVGKPAPAFEAAALDGVRVSPAGLVGKPVWVNFWASWCAPCRSEMPDVIAAYERNRGRGLVLLMVNFGEDEAAARQYAQVSGVPGTIVLDPMKRIAARYHINGLPTHVFVDAQGNVQRVFIGSINPELATRYLAEIVGP